MSKHFDSNANVNDNNSRFFIGENEAVDWPQTYKYISESYTMTAFK